MYEPWQLTNGRIGFEYINESLFAIKQKRKMNMLKIKLFSKLVPIFLIVSIFFTACDIPDISEFTTQSAEMTRAIRKGVKNTDLLLDSISTNPLFENDLQVAFDEQHSLFQKEFKPTLKALDSLDSYLEALNNLVKAQKKSKENAETAINAVGNLVSAVSGLTVPNSVVKLASGLLGQFEKARLEKDFKKRVNLVAEIVEGKTHPIAKEGVTIYKSKCTDETVDLIIDDKIKTPQQKATEIQQLDCGIIDYIKINVKFLKNTNSDLSEILLARLYDKNEVLLSYRINLQDNSEIIRKERSYILRYKNKTTYFNDFQNHLNLGFEVEKAQIMNEYAKKLVNANATEQTKLKTERDKKINKAKDTKDKDIQKKLAEDKKIIENILNFIISQDQDLLQLKRDLLIFDQNCANAGNCINVDIQNNRRIIIIQQLESRDTQLEAISRTIDINLQRIEPEYIQAKLALEQLNDKKTQLNLLLDSSLDALDAWKETHINMRVSLNTKKPLTISVLVARVREMWEILKPVLEK